MNLNFILDENYLAYYILSKKMYNESDKISSIKEALLKNNDLGYKKILNQEILDTKIYLNDNNIKIIIEELIQTKIFNQIYQSYNNESKEKIAIKLLLGYVKNNNIELEQAKDALWAKYMDAYKKLLNMNSYNPTNYLSDKDVMNTINNLKNTKEFKKLYEETKDYTNSIKKSWHENQDMINDYLKNILKIEFNIHLNVYISHPNCYEGFSFGDNNIAWGHFKGIDEPNYNLTYLIHEGLHHIIPFNNNDNELTCNIKHSIIELASDYELYSLLKKESTINEGHQHLNEYKRIIYPYWLRYIGLNNKEIVERQERDSIYNDNYIEDETINIKKININEFINYIITNWNNIIQERIKIDINNENKFKNK